MPRIRKEAIVRRNEILDAAQRLIYTKGYEQMSIQDILDELQITKGAIYYYFDSKEALLEALLERMGKEAESLLWPIVNDTNLSALEKFRRLFTTASEWKTEHRSQIIPLVRVWYSDENLLARRKRNASGEKFTVPLFAGIIRQGVQEGVFNTPYPDQTAGVIYTLKKSLGEKVGELLLASVSEAAKLSQILSLLAVHDDILERILGAPSGSLQLIDPELMSQWVSGLPTNT